MQGNLHRVGCCDWVPRKENKRCSLVTNMGTTLWLWVVMILLLVEAWCCLGGCLEKERIALLQLKANINYPNGTSLPSWAEEETTNCCQWEGVECNTTTSLVSKLSINYTRDYDSLGDWYFNASLFLPFEDLITLLLPGNHLAGWVENEGFESLSRLSNLEVLDLSDNYFNNSVLSSLSGLSSLKYLNLEWNDLRESTHFNSKSPYCVYSTEGTLLVCFGRLTGLRNLEVLDLSNNQLNNNIHSFIKLDDFISLKELDLSYNQIESFEPVQGIEKESRFDNLEVLDLSHNNFNNNIWSSLNGLSSLKTLYLMDNMLNGTTHSQDFENWSSIENLFLDGANLDINFLTSIGVMTSLQVLSMQNCGLTGSLSIQGLCELKILQELDLKGNELWGNLPWCLMNLTSLRFLDISYNHFTGNIALSPLINLTSLEYLKLSENRFQIPISFKSFFNHSKLKFLESLNNKLLVEEDFLGLAPSFQLIGIRLSDSEHDSLRRAFPLFLYHQHNLQKVELSRIDFNGKFPNWLLENNKGMVTLLLPDNSLCGLLWLPSNPATNLLALDISNNHLQGRIPYKIASIFPSLKFLNMSKNGFEGGIPCSLGDMISLDILDLSNNRLSGEIPVHLAIGCSFLTFLKLSNNSLKGPILPPQNNLTTLEYLYLDRNQFTEIPHSFSGSSYLMMLNVSYNQLLGRIPGWMGKMAFLQVLDMSNNHLEGPIPIEFCQLDRLVVLDLSENNITGTIPFCSKPPMLIQVQLSKNMLHGPFPMAFRNSTFLRMLDLSDNHLSSNLPDWISNLSTLSILLLKNNHFEGNIPNQICHLPWLTLIDLSFNVFDGIIPPCLNVITFKEVPLKLSMWNNFGSIPYLNFTSLLYNLKMQKMKQNVYLESDKFLGPEAHIELTEKSTSSAQVEFTTKGKTLIYKGVVLELLSGIDLSNNKLTGNIPLEIGNLSQIKVLNLSHNNLTGAISATFSNLKNIESLDLSYNYLTGKIPSQLTELYFLEVFNVSYNNLTGRIPQVTAQFGTFDSSSYVGNPLLCGEPLTTHCSAIDSPPSTPTATNGHEVDLGFIDMNAFYLSFAGSYITMLLGIAAILYINPYWRQAWFHLVEASIKYCYYFVVDNLRRPKGRFLKK